MKTLSSGHLELFRLCPARYSYRYHEGITPSVDGRVHMGSSLHRTLEAFTRHMWGDQLIASIEDIHAPQTSLFPAAVPPLPDVELLLALLLTHWIPLEKENHTHMQRAEDALKIWYSNQSAHLMSTRGVEVSFRSLLGSTGLIGRIDRIDVREGEIWVVDYKSHAPSPPFPHAPLQMQLYAFVLMEAYPRIPRIHLYHDYLLTGTGTHWTVTREEVQWVQQCIIALIAAEKAEHFPATPEETTCRSCPYRTFCPSAHAASHQTN